MTKMKAVRLAKGWTLQDAGFRARVQAAHLSQIERGILRPYPKQMKRLARVLGLTVEELLEEVEEYAAIPAHAD